MPVIIEARGLTKRFGDLTAVDGIDFHIEEGEVFGILGPNGAGKTSTIRMITCVLPITAGNLTVAGMNARDHDREIKAVLGVVPQANNLDQDLSVRKNLEVYARYFDVPKDVAAPRIDEALDLMQLSDRAGSSIHALSGGMQRRLVVARALVNAPRLLILDEPTTGLDPQARHLVWRKLRLLRERGITVVLTSHYMDEAERICDRLVIMHEGRILDAGAPRTLIQRHVGGDVLELQVDEGEEARVRDRLAPALHNGARLERMEDTVYAFGLDAQQAGGIERLLGSGRDDRRTHYRPGNLEDVFLRLTGRALVE